MFRIPVDILTFAALKYIEIPEGRIMGIGTVADTARVNLSSERNSTWMPAACNTFINRVLRRSEFRSDSSVSPVFRSVTSLKCAAIRIP